VYINSFLVWLIITEREISSQFVLSGTQSLFVDPQPPDQRSSQLDSWSSLQVRRYESSSLPRR